MPDGRGRRLALLVGVVALAAACGKHPPVAGSGTSKTENRNVGIFTKARVDGAANLVVTIGTPSTFAVTADDNLLSKVETKVTKGELLVTTPPSWKPVTPPTIQATVPSLTDVELNGIGTITVNGLAAKAFEAHLQGTGLLTAAGKVDAVTAVLDGTGRMELGNLVAQQGDVTINGAGTATVDAEKKLKARVNGAGKVSYNGQPQLDAKVTGAGNVTKAP
jgi:hypothetical protein